MAPPQNGLIVLKHSPTYTPFFSCCRLFFRDLLDASVRHHGDQGDAPLADDGGMLLARRRQVCRYSEGEGAEEGADAADQPVEHVRHGGRHFQPGGHSCDAATTVPTSGEQVRYSI
jgi:hypothetical protein